MKKLKEEENRSDFSLFNIKRTLFFLTSSFLGAGMLIDIFLMEIGSSDPVYMLNLVSIGIFTSLVVLNIFTRRYLFHSNLMVLYVFLFNILYSLWLNITIPEFTNFLLRELIFLSILIFAAGFMLNKYHALSIGIFTIVFYIIVLNTNETKFLRQNAALILFALATYSTGVFLILLLLQKMHRSHKKLMEQLERKNEILNEQKAGLKVLNNTKDKLMSIVSHDLKSPISGFIGISEMISESLEKKDYDAIKRFNDAMRRSALQTTSLVTNLLDWTRNQTGQIKFEPVYLDFQKSFHSIYDELIPTARLKNISINCQCPENTEVYADPYMLSVILRNLVNNAVKFSEKDSTIIISATPQQHYTEISIQDNGVGMNKSQMKKLFNEKAGDSTVGTSNEQGTGLGLIICKEFMDIHNGKINVESSQNTGTGFTLKFPDAS